MTVMKTAPRKARPCPEDLISAVLLAAREWNRADADEADVPLMHAVDAWIVAGTPMPSDSPALRALVRAAERECMNHMEKKDCRFCRAVARFRKERERERK